MNHPGAILTCAVYDEPASGITNVTLKLRNPTKVERIHVVGENFDGADSGPSYSYTHNSNCAVMSNQYISNFQLFISPDSVNVESNECTNGIQ